MQPARKADEMGPLCPHGLSSWSVDLGFWESKEKLLRLFEATA